MIAAALARFLLESPAAVPTALREVLAKYPAGSGVAAVFTTDPPPDSGRPCIVIRAGGGGDWSDRTNRGAERELDAAVHGDKTTSLSQLLVLAWELWDALHRADLAPYLPVGVAEVGVNAEPPNRAEDADGFPGFRVRVRVREMET